MQFHKQSDLDLECNKKHIHIKYLISFLAIKYILSHMAANDKNEVVD